MKSLTELLKSRAEKADKVKSLFGKGNDMAVEDLNEIKTLNGEIESLNTEIKEAEFLETARKNAETISEHASRIDYSIPGIGKSDHDGVETVGAIGAGSATISEKGILEQEGEALWTEGQFAAANTKAYKDAFRQYMRGGVNVLSSAEIRTLQEASDQQGGYLVPEDIQAALIQKKPTPTRVAGMVQSFNTSRDVMVFPKSVYTTDNLYTTGMRVKWTGETGASATAHRTTDPEFGAVRIPIYTAMMSLALTNDMIEDSAFPVLNWVTSKFAETSDLLRDNMILNGTGVGQPSGIIPFIDSTDGVASIKSGNANLLTADGLIDVAFDIPEQYDENARWLCNKVSTAKAVAKLKDGQNRYLWGSGLQDSGLRIGGTDRDILGYPVTLSGFMPDVAANKFPLLFGDFRAYYLVNRVGFSVQVLRERYAEENQIVVLGRVRFGGQTAEPWRLRAQKVAA